MVPVKSQFNVKSIHGINSVTHKCRLAIFGVESQFFVLPQLSTFDGIIGLDLLLRVGAQIDLKLVELATNSGSEPIEFHKCQTVNFSLVNKPEVPECVKANFEKLIEDRQAVFANPDEALPYNTNVVATIRTTDNDPVYTKLYPYPGGVTEFVNKEMETLLKNNIIRPSRSPYNNPIWVVDKKGYDEFGNRNKRMVIDFRKLNQKTIDDKYPIPNIKHILTKLGKSNFYSTLDLKSGFFQINLAERDREKTAFSVNNGKYEFCRLPFGLKNAPSIFQRAVDDVLREGIGKFLDIYIDDLIIYSENEEEHVRHIQWALDKLLEANMRVNIEKSFFFKTEVEYLGFIVSREGIRTCPSKVEAIRNFPEPSNLYELRSFLGLSGYYRGFIKDYGSIAKPLTDIFRGDYGLVSANRSRKLRIEFNIEQREAFNKLRLILSSEQVILLYPDFSQPFELTTDASSVGLGAVLSQNGRPITMISRSLKDKEEEFATNERELLAIVWALQKLQNYLYGVKNLKIFTDHRPLTFSVSDKNSNAKLKRWMAYVEGHNAKISFKPGKENLVADALSRQTVNALDNVSTSATIHSEESLTNVIRRTETPLNCYKNQIVLEESDAPSKRTIILFRSKKRHIVGFNSRDEIIDLIKELVVDRAVNAIHCDLHTLAFIQHRLVQCFPATKFWHAPNLVIDVTNRDEQREVLVAEHVRAHRGAQNIVETVLKDYYFPKMGKLASEVVNNCGTCMDAKYLRHPIKQKLGLTPIPSRPGERIHIDIFSTDGKFFLTSIDKFSKFALVQQIQSRSLIDVSPALLNLINIYPNVEFIYCDNEATFNSHTVNQLLSRYGIQLSNSPPHHSTSNGQVERFHSTLAEIARCLKEDRQITDTVELIQLSTIEYNKTIHSVTRETPLTVIHSSSPGLHETVRARLVEAQTRQLHRFNRNRSEVIYDVGELVRVKTNRRIGNKLSPRFVKRRIQADLGTTVLIRGKIVHKDNLRRGWYFSLLTYSYYLKQKPHKKQNKT